MSKGNNYLTRIFRALVVYRRGAKKNGQLQGYGVMIVPLQCYIPNLLLWMVEAVVIDDISA